MAKQIAYNMDCMEAMREMPDKAFELAIVDPPYGINMDGGKIGGDNKGRATDYIKKTWDKKAPEDEYFVELLRVSKNQIVFGANHFISHIPFDSPCWVVWDKDNTGNFADCELAWTSFKSAVRKYEFRWNGMLQGNMANKEIRIHPTQKPVALYEWLLRNYAKPGDKILDTHLGSGSSRIAAYNLGFDFVGYEIDKDYFEAQEERFKKHTAQIRLFDLAPEPTEEQLQII
jgi:site-specific DNA-methyltransferase (adenine-specific)